jgi:phosphoribosylformylglycinamidine synthase
MSIETYRALHKAIQAGLVQSCHDCSEGGLAVALAEMCIAGRLGASIVVPPLADNPRWLYSESLCRFVVEVRQKDAETFENALGDGVYRPIGMVATDTLIIHDQEPEHLVHVSVDDLERAWRGEPVGTHSRASLQTAQVTTRGNQDRIRSTNGRTTPARVLILHANGTNRDHEAAMACEMASAVPEIVHVNQLLSGERHLLDYHMLVVPGGFSYGDELGAGKLGALDLRERFGEDMRRFVDDGRPVLGICNGFQTLVKTGLLPGAEYDVAGHRAVTLTFNESAHFECRWVYLQANPNSTCLFTEGLEEMIHCPVAHGEGRLAMADQATLNRLSADGLVALSYVDYDGSSASYPANPNGSMMNIAGICNRAGNVFGLMPHPENHIFWWQHPRWRRGESGMDGLRLFKNGIKYA